MKKIQQLKWIGRYKRFSLLFLAVVVISLALAGFVAKARLSTDQDGWLNNNAGSSQPDMDAQAVLSKQDHRPIAKVGKKAVPRWMFDNAMNDRLGKGWETRKLPAEEVKETREKIVDNLVTMALLEAEAEKAGIRLSPGAGVLRGKIIEGSFKNRQAFLEALAAAGMTEQQYQEIWQQQAVVNMLVKENIEAKVKIDEADVQALYEKRRPGMKRPPQIRARHILIKTDKNTSPEDKKTAEKKAAEILEKLRQGADFAELAAKHSDCDSKKKGGDLGWFDENQMDIVFSQAAFALEDNEISDLVNTRFGFHIIRKTGYRPEGLAAYEDVKDALREELVKAKARTALDKYVAGLKKRAKIEIFQ